MFNPKVPHPPAILILSILLLYSGIFAAQDRPNIILLLADDLGYQDLSCFGSPAVETPNLDRLATEGAKYTNFHSASAVCTPTRVSIMTGSYPLRWGVTRHFNDVDMWLPEASITVAELLRDAGYTTIHVGKWHLGGLHVGEDGKRLANQPGPHEHGFKYYQTQIEQQPIRGQMGSNRTLFRQGGTVLLRNGHRVEKEDPYYPKHFTDANGDFAVEMIEKSVEEGNPFFLNLWWLVPHKPYEPAPEPHWSNTAASGISEDQHCFRSMMEHMDANVGKVLDKLDELGIADNTLVIFTSDNGAAFEGYIGDLKGGKTDLHEGGIRVPFLARWPDAIAAGKESDLFGSTIDLLPTFCDAANVFLPAGLSIDGMSLLPSLIGPDDSGMPQRGTVFWQLQLYKKLQRHYPKPEPYATEVAQRGDWKMLARDGVPVALYHLGRDVNETRNIMDSHPELVDSMARELRAWLAEPRKSWMD